MIDQPRAPAQAAANLVALTPDQRHILMPLLAAARRPAPRDWLPLYLGDQPIGVLAPQRVAPLLAVLPGCGVQGRRLVWLAQDLTPDRRSLQIQQAAERLRELGLISGWRDEAYRFEAAVDDPLQDQGAELFRLERAAFRFFGLRSRAVHVNGFSAEGGLWCGRRAMNKATDPGLLDNLAAGGLPAGESFKSCAIRELGEEAGVDETVAHGAMAGGVLRCTRVEAEGLHDEILHIYNLTLPLGFQPQNRDGEVAEFVHLLADGLMLRLRAGEFTEDAAAVIATALLARAECLDGAN